VSIAEFVYTTVIRVPLLRVIVNSIILTILPKFVSVGKAKIFINPNDPVVSGALTFGVYENQEISLMQQMCRPGMTMIDVGANVGLYTAIAGLGLGESGRVFAFEPEPESFECLQKTVNENGLTNVTVVQAAAAAENSKTKLYTSSLNRGDHRMYRNEHSDGSVEIDTLKLDDYLENKLVKGVDVIKIDVQGFEGHVIAGLEGTICRSPSLAMLMEFWPKGLLSAGTSPVELLEKLRGLGLTVFELNGRGYSRVGDLTALVDRLTGRKYVNLLLLGPKAELVSKI